MIDCKIVEIPPKLITKLQRIVASVLLGNADNEMLPFVISIVPSRNPCSADGKKENKGDKVSMMIKKMVIKQPTDRIESVEFVTMSDKVGFSVCVGKEFVSLASFFVLRFRQHIPFAIAPKMWLANKTYPIFAL